MSFNNQALTARDSYLKKKRNKKLLQYGIVTFLIIFIIGLLAYVAKRPELTISKVELSGGTLVTQSDVETLSLEFLQGNYLWIFPVRNAFWYPKGQLEKYLLQSFQRIDTIQITRKDFHTLSITITEKKPYAIWCDSLSSDAGSSNCYFMDSNSVIFAEAPDFSGDAYFKYYGLSTSTNPIGTVYMASSTEFEDIQKLISTADKLSLGPKYLVAKDDGDFSLFTTNGGEIIFDTVNPLSTTIDNLQTLLKSQTLSADLGKIDYIDLRFGNKLFYKLKQ